MYFELIFEKNISSVIRFCFPFFFIGFQVVSAPLVEKTGALLVAQW